MVIHGYWLLAGHYKCACLKIFNRVTEAYETITVAAETRIVGPFARATYNDRRDRVLMGIQIPAENTAPNFGVFSL